MSRGETVGFLEGTYGVPLPIWTEKGLKRAFGTANLRLAEAEHHTVVSQAMSIEGDTLAANLVYVSPLLPTEKYWRNAYIPFPRETALEVAYESGRQPRLVRVPLEFRLGPVKGSILEGEFSFMLAMRDMRRVMGGYTGWDSETFVELNRVPHHLILPQNPGLLSTMQITFIRP